MGVAAKKQEMFFSKHGINLGITLAELGMAEAEDFQIVWNL